MDTFKVKYFLSLSGAIAMASISGYVFYRFFLKDEDDDGFAKPSLPPPIPVKTKKLKIPTSAIGVVIGRQGSNIKNIESSTKTSIHFKDDGEEKICIIKGSATNVENAELLIQKTIEEIPIIEMEELFIPSRAVGRIIGSGGATVQLLSRSTGAKIKVGGRDEDVSDGFKDESLRKVVIRGTLEQIQGAKAAIELKVEEHEEMRQRIKMSAENISQRSRSKNSHSNNNIMDTEAELKPAFEGLSSNSDMYIPAYISALESPAHFWLQVCGPRTVELDKLVNRMTEYYNDPDCQTLHTLKKHTSGDIVAAVFPHDNLWYRGRICPTTENDDPSKIVVYFLDFGDTECVDPQNIRELRTDFLSLNFQAIECFLANIDLGAKFSEESIEVFENLSHALKWKQIMVKVVEYKEDNGTTIPCVRLVDTSDSNDIDVGKELVERGLANWATDEVGHHENPLEEDG